MLYKHISIYGKSRPALQRPVFLLCYGHQERGGKHRSERRKALLSCLGKKGEPFEIRKENGSKRDLASGALRGLNANCACHLQREQRIFQMRLTRRQCRRCCLSEQRVYTPTGVKRQKGEPLNPEKKDKKRAAAPCPGKQTERPPPTNRNRKGPALPFQFIPFLAKFQYWKEKIN